VCGETVDFGVGNPMMAARCLSGPDPAFVDPVLERRVTDAETLGSGADGQESHIDPA
jgi:hypothetical protein